MKSNLWEALIQRSVQDFEQKHHKKEWNEYLHKLGESACLSYQELSLEPDKRGWIIHIFACNENGKVTILIPKDRTQPIEILVDTRKESTSYRDE